MKLKRFQSLMVGTLLASVPAVSSAQCPGVLLVNEISNGSSGSQEFVELMAAATDCGMDRDSVDVSGWIIDDNNGIFSGSTASGFGISQGHYRLSENAIWEEFPTGKLIVLFNNADFNSSISAFATASGNIDGFLNTDSCIYVAVGASSLVIKYTASPNSSDGNYCTSTNNQDPAANYAGMSLRNACGGDGIQTRCPGCSTEQGLGEPSLFHGFSYGSDNGHVVNPNTDFLDAAYIGFSVEDTICGALRNFYLNAGTGSSAPEVDANWAMGVDSVDATPGASNSADNATFRASVAAGTHVYNACPQPSSGGSTGSGILMVTEISNGPSGTCEYAELVVANCAESPFDEYVDIQGWILDDNNGAFTGGAGPGLGITTGHLRFAFGDVWDSVKIGSIIVLFNNSSNCYNFPTDHHTIPDTNANGQVVYYLPIGGTGGTSNIESAGLNPNSGDATYCNDSYTAPSASWGGKVGLRNGGDAFQVRCPGCNDVVAGEPAFYHGIGYGSASDFTTIAATSAHLGGPVVTTSSGSGDKFVFDGTATATAPSDVANWDELSADAAGTPPATAGSLPTAFTDGIESFAFGFSYPCCSADEERSARASSQPENVVGKIDATVYPNPAEAQLFVELGAVENGVFVLTDISGKVILQQNITSENTKLTFDVSSIPSGIYVYRIDSNTGSATGKVVIK